MLENLRASAAMTLNEPSATEPRDKHSAMLQTLEHLYRPKQRLRSHDKRVIKQILSLRQGLDGQKGVCCFCKQPGDVEKDLQIHHLDYIESHNQLANLALAHQPCNSRDHALRQAATNNEVFDLSRHGSVSESETKRGSHTTTDEQTGPYEQTVPESERGWTSREGAKHDVMRYKWNKWVRDLENGPFANTKGANVSRLAKRAPWALGKGDQNLGSSITYRRMIEEDIEGGVLKEWWDEESGKRFVSLAVTAPETEQV